MGGSVAGGTGAGPSAVDHVAVFRSMPTAYLLMDRDLVIVDANEAYLAMMGRRLEELVGSPVLEAFPSDADGERELRSSFERARDTGRADPMPLFRYAIPDGAGGFTDRSWSLISVPVPDADGRVALVAQRVEDVTDFVREQERGEAAAERGQAYQQRFERAEADLFARAQELRSALEAKDVAAARLAGLAEVALQLAGAEDVEALTSLVFGTGLPVLGASGAAIAVRTPGSDVLDLVMTGHLDAAARAYSQLPMDSSLPAAVAARGQEVLLADELATAQVPGLDEARALAGFVAVASLPLRVGERVLGSLTTTWARARAFTPEDVELLRAFAAQCAQALDRVQALAAERAAAARVQRMSETLQRSLLTPPPKSDDLDVAVRYQPAATLALVGGDWYDAFITPEGSTSLVIGDVAGHDRDAAAAMGQVRNVLRGVAQTLGKPPAAVLTALDEALHRLDLDLLATVLLADVARTPPLQRLLPGRSRPWRLTWSSAGHPPPLLVRADGTARFLEGEPDLLVGLDPGSERHDHAADLGPGDVVVLYTDGLVERRGESLDDGLERLRAVAEQCGRPSADAWCDTLLAGLGADPDDDIALLVVRVQPDAG